MQQNHFGETPQEVMGLKWRGMYAEISAERQGAGFAAVLWPRVEQEESDLFVRVVIVDAPAEVCAVATRFEATAKHNGRNRSALQVAQYGLAVGHMGDRVVLIAAPEDARN